MKGLAVVGTCVSPSQHWFGYGIGRAYGVGVGVLKC